MVLPPPVRAFLNGEDLQEKQHDAMLFVTVGADGFPYKAMLSVGEVVALDESSLRMAIWTGTQSEKNALTAKKATLMFVWEQVAYDIRLQLERIATLEQLTLFAGEVISVKADKAPYAVLDSGVRYTLHKPGEALVRWERVIAQMRLY
ncbi:pyridoxamine 5'-phosphate oxidase family protein [Shouchella lonarensis]|uniref:Pyridoxamine 5'-phosphate oxidase n=1 Tax=Shouchella lonarensis TaxID=1464122 RepID=A0A1G6HSU4_9BACI|nr:pyridoxamine 5'-phosphate oxidase family protein [Shouchella lonarensis]SDB97301.1 Pyridoxamine 5'-phosphate oxidase [Shouchella lonarensis]